LNGISNIGSGNDVTTTDDNVTYSLCDVITPKQTMTIQLPITTCTSIITDNIDGDDDKKNEILVKATSNTSSDNPFLIISYKLSNILCCISLLPDIPLHILDISPRFISKQNMNLNDFLLPINHITYLNVIKPVWGGVARVVTGQDHHSDIAEDHIEVTALQESDSKQAVIQQHHAPWNSGNYYILEYFQYF
jgi:hypothetical protein